MTRFLPVYVRRSDGRTETFSKGKRSEANEPTAEQLDQRPDKNGVSDFYREVPMEEAKNLDWRRKLGGMLAREMEQKDKNARFGSEMSYMLVAFPENYRLYEHVKKTERDGKLEVKSKTHAAGGNDRQDAYLYGHPVGRKKRYRSPAEFFPHLLWLCTDESGDPDNCSCKLCQPEEQDGPDGGGKSKKKKKVAIPLLQSDIQPAPGIPNFGVSGSAFSAASQTISARPALSPLLPAGQISGPPRSINFTPTMTPQTQPIQHNTSEMQRTNSTSLIPQLQTTQTQGGNDFDSEPTDRS